MKIKSLSVTTLSVNTYFCTTDSAGIVIDPGGEPKRLIEFIKDESIRIDAILLTHGHFDHIGAVDKIKEHTGASVYAHRDEAALLSDGKMNMSAKMRRSVIEITADVLVADGDKLCFGDIGCRVIHLPGHTPGGAAFYFEDDKVLFSGDILFKESIGRSDFVFGDSDALLRGIREKLFILPEDVVVYSGHGEPTTIGHEKRNNPYVRATE